MQTSRNTAPESGLVPAGRFFFKYRNLLFPVVFSMLAFGTQPRVQLGDPRADYVLQALGVLVVVSGQGLRCLVIGVTSIRRGGKNKLVFAENLVQTGLFAHSRNPLYVGNLLIIAGLVLIHGGSWMYLVFLPFFLFVYISIVAAEELYLSGHFGPEYTAYCSRVPRFLPRLHGLLATIRGMGFKWKRLLRTEYGTMFLSITSVLSLLAWKCASVRGFENSQELVQPLAIVWITSLLAYLTARILKRYGAPSAT